MSRGWICFIALVLVAAWTLVAHADRGDHEAKRIADRLVRRWAPVYVQHVGDDDRGRDRPTRIDFDGDWVTTNNWNNLSRFRHRLPAAAYSAGILSETHAYLTYTLYYPRDWRDGLCISFVCHDNDLETVMMVVERDDADGRLVQVRAKAHLDIADTSADEIARTTDGRPLLRVESEGHGITVCKPGDPGCTARPGRLVYVPGETGAISPTRARGQVVTYELLSLHETLWQRRDLANSLLWIAGETGPLYYRSERFGRLGRRMGASLAGSRYRGGVRPPWAVKGAVGSRGDWFLDPAAQAAVMSDGASTRYVYNPYLDDLAAECTGRACARGPRREPSRAEFIAKTAAPYVLLSLGLVLVTGHMRRL